jgi:hypothetical protein
MLTGEVLLSNCSLPELFSRIEAAPRLSARSSNIPPPALAVIEKALAVDPQDRWPTCGEFAWELCAQLESGGGDKGPEPD